MQLHSTNHIAYQGRKLALDIIIVQAVVGLLAAIVIGLFLGYQHGITALIGAVCNLVPSIVFAIFAFRYVGATKSRLIMQSFRKGAALKLLITMLMFALVFKKLEVEPLPLVLGYIATLLAQWPTMFFKGRKQ